MCIRDRPYTPIVPFEVLSARLGRPAEQLVKLDANENPYGPPPGALAALAAGRAYHIYPDPEANALRDALSRTTGQPKARLLVGMGADELIDLVLRALLEPGDAVIDCPPTFGMYPFSTAVNEMCIRDRVVEEVRRHFPNKVFKTIIPRNVRLSEAPSFGQPINFYAPQSPGAIAYKLLTAELISGDRRNGGGEDGG